MEEREKIKKIYEKANVKVSEDYIDNIMKDDARVKDFMRMYKQEEICSMNEILGKPHDNSYFTEFELEVCSKVDLFNRNVIKWSKLIWKNRDNEEELDKIISALQIRREELAHAK